MIPGHPGTPRSCRLNGKVARSHRIDGEEFYQMLKGVVIDDTPLFNDKLAEWQDFYNYHRPHGALSGQSPYERLRQKTTATQAPSKRSTSAAQTTGEQIGSGLTCGDGRRTFSG